MSWVAIGVGVGTTALSIGANYALSSQGGGGGINTKQIKDALAEGMSQINAAIDAGRAATAASVAGMDKKIQKAVLELRDASDRETREFWNKLGLFNDQLINSASALVNTYNGDVNKALETLQTTVSGLNESYSKDMGEEISRYGSVEAAINAQLAVDSKATKDEFLQNVEKAQKDYSDASLAEADTAKAESLSLGDQFMQRADAALGRFDRVATQSPEFLAEATRAADTLSKAALQTRADLLATADPRALELSAIADENAAALMSGRISADTQANLARSSAMRALQGGFGASSEMGRGLAARDLGLTALDLQQRGTQDYERQRALNYETRVAGTQVNPFDVSTQMQNAEGTLLGQRLGTAESDRNQRLGAVQEAAGQRLQTFDRVFGSRLGAADTVRGQDMTVASQRADMARDANIRTTGMRIGATQDIYNNTLGLTDTIFNTRTGLAGQTFQTGLSLVGDIYKTNVGATGTAYGARLGTERDIFGQRGQAAVAGMQAQAAYEQAALQAASGVISGNTATMANIPVMQAAQRNAGAMQSAQIWGSALQAGSSLAGSYLGSQNWSNLGQGRSYGGNPFTNYSSSSYVPTGNYTGNVSNISSRPVPLPAGA